MSGILEQDIERNLYEGYSEESSTSVVVSFRKDVLVVYSITEKGFAESFTGEYHLLMEVQDAGARLIKQIMCVPACDREELLEMIELAFSGKNCIINFQQFLLDHTISYTINAFSG